jgi:ATP-dependent DNA ligase
VLPLIGFEQCGTRREPALRGLDVLWLNGKDLRAYPLRRRKKVLDCPVTASTTVVSKVFVVEKSGRALLAAAERPDLEGIVAKRKADPYAAGAVWYKVKNRAYTQMEERWELFQQIARSSRLSLSGRASVSHAAAAD